MDTPETRFATIVGARIVIVTVKPARADTASLDAAIVESAEITVVAFGIVGDELTALLGITGIVGAEVIVVANEQNLSLAVTLDTHIAIGAKVEVVARRAVVDMETPAKGFTRVVGARVEVIAVQKSLVQALATTAVVAGSAIVPVVASFRVGQIGAPALHVTIIIGADVGIVTNHWHAAKTLALDARIANCAGIGIITGKTLVIRYQCALPGSTIT